MKTAPLTHRQEDMHYLVAFLEVETDLSWESCMSRSIRIGDNCPLNRDNARVFLNVNGPCRD